MSKFEQKSIPKKGAHLYKHGLSGHPLYGRWRGMVQRCEDVNYYKYKYYGGKGITVCKRWKEFPNFLEDMGVPPDGYSLDRIDSNGDYSPNNCRWSTTVQQMQNRSNSIILEFNGIKQCLTLWAKTLGIGKAALTYRIKSGWPLEKALTSVFYNSKGKEINHGN